MPGLTTGLSAIRTAQQLIDMAAGNIANANTPGYHVRRANVVAELGATIGGLTRGGGVRIDDIFLVRDELIERTLLNALQSRERLGQEVALLEHIEGLFGEPSDTGLDAQLAAFFDTAVSLSADPADALLRQQLIQRAETLCSTLNRLDRGLAAMVQDAFDSLNATLGRINELTARIADLNVQIRSTETASSSAGGLRDTRDRYLSELAGLIGVRPYADEHGIVNVGIGGMLVVDAGTAVPLTLARDAERIVVTTDDGFEVEAADGHLAGVLAVVNDLIPNYSSRLDELANGLRRAVNAVQTTGLGAAGRFHELRGLNAFLTNGVSFADAGYGVVAGAAERLCFNVENEASGQITSYVLTLDTTQGAADFLADLRDRINALGAHVTASIEDGRLVLTSESGYAFDFATPYDPNPAQAGDITALDPTTPAILDHYAGAEDLAYTIRFLSGGRVGQDPLSLQVEVRDADGALVRTLTRSVRADYLPGDGIELENGLRLALSAGDVNAGDAFSFTARASMDTAGVLDALGLNVFFTGLGAGSIAVADTIRRDPALVATGITTASGDNHKVLDLLALREGGVFRDGTASLTDFYRQIVGDVATAYASRKGQLQNQSNLVTALENRRDAVSGVSVDEEMVRLIESRRIYQGGLKVIQLINRLLDELASML